MTTWYRVNKYYNEIKPVTVVKETEKSLVLEQTRPSGKVDHYRAMKDSTYDIYFPSWTEAHEHLLRRCNQAVEVEKAQLEWALSNRAEVEAMVEPKEEGK